MNRNVLVLALFMLVPTPANAATKTYDVERIHVRLNDSELGGRGWVFLEDVKGLRSKIEAVLLSDEGAILFKCETFSPATPVRDYNIVQVGQFAQQATANTAPLDAVTPGGGCKITVSCEYEGFPIGTAIDHVTINHTGTYRSLGDGSRVAESSYKITGHRDRTETCDVTLNSMGPIFGTAILSRFSQVHTGDTRFADFYRDPVEQPGVPFGWLNLRDVTFPF